MITLIFWLVIIGLAVAYWPIALGIFALWLVYCFWSAAREEERKRLGKARVLNANIPKYLHYVTDGKTERTRLNNVEQVISNLKQVIELDPDGRVAPNAKELLKTMDACSRTISIETALAKAEKAVFKNQRKPAMNAYLDALFAAKKLGTTNADFIQARCVCHDTGKPVTIEDIVKSAMQMGWDGVVRT